MGRPGGRRRAQTRREQLPGACRLVPRDPCGPGPPRGPEGAEASLGHQGARGPSVHDAGRAHDGREAEDEGQEAGHGEEQFGRNGVV